MTNWIKTVDIKPILQQFNDVEHEEDIDVVGCAAALLELLTRELPEYVELYGEGLAKLVDDGPEYASLDELNYEIDGLYDYGDNCKIWLGI